MADTRPAAFRPGGLVAYFVRHRTIANLVLLAMLAIGVAAMTKIRSQFFPDVVVETVNVRMAWRGAGADDVDRNIVAVIEPAVIAIEGVEEVKSTAREGVAFVSVDFEPGTDMGRALDDVKAAIDTIRNFPDTAEEPVIRRAAWRDLVTLVVITGPVGTDQLALLADELVGRLFKSGVTRTLVRGVSDPRITVELSEAAMIRHDVSIARIAAAISAEAEADPAGDVTGSSTRVRSGIEKRTAEEIGGITLKTNPDGSKLRIRDVANVELEGTQSRIAFFAGENPAVMLIVERSEQGDAIAIQDTVARAVDEMQLTVPEGVTVQLARSRAEAISSRLDTLIDNGLTGLMLVLLLLFLFLDMRTAFWVAAGIPAAMLAALGLMYAAGLTINMVSLFALILCLGIVVDDAIVVGEYTDQLNRYGGVPPHLAAERGSLRMLGPVAASSITTIIAFTSLTLVGGRMGTLVADIPFTVSVVLIASLIECFLILPNHMAHSLRGTQSQHWYDAPSRAFNRGFDWFRQHVFRRLIAGVVRLRYPALAGAVAILAHSGSMFLSGELRFIFFNPPEEGNITGNFAMVPGTTREETEAMMQELQRAVQAVAARYETEDGTNPLAFVMGQVGRTSGRGLSGQDSKQPDELGAVVVELIDPDLRSWNSGVFVARLEEEVRRHPLLETLSFRRGRFGPGGSGVEVRLFDADPPTLKAAAEALKQRLDAVPIVSGPEDNLSYDKTEMVLELTPLGEALGLTIDSIGRELYSRLSGLDAAEFPVGLRTGTIRVRMAESDVTADFLSRTRLRTSAGDYVPLADAVTVTPVEGFSTVRRVNGQRVVTVTADIDEEDADAATAFRETMETEILPTLGERFGVKWEQGGLVEQEREFISDALIGFAACLIGIFACLAWVFGSWWRPVVVMLIIPFGFIGAAWGHWFWGLPMSMFSIVGLIGMTGIIVNDSIVLISTIDEHAERRALVPALIEATSTRLRPVLLTTLTTVFGMAPLLYEPSVQAQFLKPTVIAICYGLGFGVVLVLIVVPAAVAVQRDIGRLVRSFRRGLRATDHRLGAARAQLRLATGLVLAWLAITVGYQAVEGAVAPGPAALASAVLPMASPAQASLLAFVSGLIAIVLGFAIAAGLRSRRQPHNPAAWRELPKL